MKLTAILFTVILVVSGMAFICGRLIHRDGFFIGAFSHLHIFIFASYYLKASGKYKRYISVVWNKLVYAS